MAVKRKAKEPEAPKFMVGDRVGYNGKVWKITQLFGANDQYAAIDRPETCISVEVKSLEKVWAD